MGTITTLKQSADSINLTPENDVFGLDASIDTGSGTYTVNRCAFWRVGQTFFLMAVVQVNASSGENDPLFIVASDYAAGISRTFDTCGVLNSGSTMSVVPIAITNNKIYIQSPGGFCPAQNSTLRFTLVWTSVLGDRIR